MNPTSQNLLIIAINLFITPTTPPTNVNLPKPHPSLLAPPSQQLLLSPQPHPASLNPLLPNNLSHGVHRSGLMDLNFSRATYWS